MRKRRRITWLLLLVVSFSIAQVPASRSSRLLLQQYAAATSDTTRVQLLLQLGAYYLYKPGEEKADLDSTLLVAEQAKVISRRMGYHQGEESAVLLTARTYQEGKNYTVIADLPKVMSDTGRVQWLVLAGSAYLMRPQELPKDLDSAVLLGKQAETLSRHLHYKQGLEDAGYLIGRTYVEWQKYPEVRALLPTLSIDTRIRVMMEMASYRLYTTKPKKADLDTALYYIRHSLALGESIHSRDLLRLGVVNWARWHAVMDNVTDKQAYLSVFGDCRNSGYLESEELACEEVGRVAHTDTTLFIRAHDCWRRVIADSKKLPDRNARIAIQERILTTIVDDANDYWDEKNASMAERGYLLAIEVDGGLERVFIHPYDVTTYFYITVGNYGKALFYGLASLRILEKNGDQESDELPYLDIAKVYYELGNTAQSVANYRKVLEIMKKKKAIIPGNMLKAAAKAFIADGREGEALSFLQEGMQKNAAQYDARNRQLINESIGNCYYAMRQYDKAEMYYLKSVELARDGLEMSKLIATVPLGKLYAETGRFEKARPYLEGLANASNSPFVPLSIQRDVQLMLFKVDSAAGSYLSAIGHLNLHKAINDTLFNETKNRQIQELQVSYATEKKDKDLKLKDRDIQLLIRQGQLQAARLQQERLQFQYEDEKKRHDLQVLSLQADKNDKDLQLVRLAAEKNDKDLRQTRLIRNISIIGALLLILVLALVYNQSRIKQKSNLLLREQQEKIYQSNLQLQQLNGQQGKLLAEKEWLIKEIHHRVKNNLQIIMSLLNMQSHYLQDEYALGAFDDVSHRMQAIALIHQKLYQTEGMSRIDMATYIRELVQYLRESSIGTNGYHLVSDIQFNMQVDPIELDVAQSVPVGLILNEAITNAIKYAFPNGSRGIITISMKEQAEKISLTISDNGRGLPKDFQPNLIDSMGFQLMEMLSEQLDGSMIVENDGGLSITVRFYPSITELAAADSKTHLAVGVGAGV